MSIFSRRKSIDSITNNRTDEQLKPSLHWPHLVALGVGAIVGTGIYTLTGIGAGLAGPAVIISFAIAGLVSACAALAYAEMATMMPAAGSAYTYSYVAMGEPIAWFVGWSLILEYTVVCAAVSVGWSAYAAGVITYWHIPLPAMLLAGPSAGGLINVPAIVISLAVAALLAAGTRESATVNFFLVLVKLSALAVFIALTLPAFDAAHFHPFMPYGWSTLTADGSKLGVLPAASLIFFAFYGFDTISTAAEEAHNPGRDLSIGIVGSMVLCTLIYMAVAAAAIGALPAHEISKSAEPLALILRTLHHPFWATVVAGAAIVALPTVVMVFMYGQSRIFFVMARDRLLPAGLAKVSARTGTPVAVTIFTGVVAAVIAGWAPLKLIAELANAGTLCAFVAVALSMILLRLRDPKRQRVFSVPLWWLVGPAAIAGCLYLFWSLPGLTQHLFFIWNGVGILVYLGYGMRKSLLARAG
ncbi:MAG: amino acid permease [Alphaproteobacteria bacterium]|nr:amino acid permease [Alphaproteobacteria bacterium]MDE2113184.1 amino acid permease [Alphaproteobacteria bacterium]MDE2494223.1 amino acid permease [Alphaproteobacteria bacterium]